MTTLPLEIEKIMNEISIEFDKASWHGRRNLDYFEVGFKTCFDLLWPVIQMQREALEKCSSQYYVDKPNKSWESVQVAKECLEQTDKMLRGEG